MKGQGSCTCTAGFLLFPFPTAKKDTAKRTLWKKLINRQDPQRKGKLWSPSKDSRVCSKHFIDGKPTPEHPNPTINLGYDARDRVNRMTSTPVRRKIERSFESSTRPTPKPILRNEDVSAEDANGAFITIEAGSGEKRTENADMELAINISVQAVFFILIQASIVLYLGKLCAQLSTKLLHLESRCKESQLEIAKLQKQVIKLKKTCTCSKPLSETFITESNVRFYTSFPGVRLFDAIHKAVAPFVKRRWKGIKCMSSKVTRKFAASPKKFGPARKLQSRDEFLLAMMKLRLGLLTKDLASRFRISVGFSSQIFQSWLRALATYLQHMVYVPNEDVIRATTPARFGQFRNIHSIIDCSEVFIETPKSHILQSATWSEYKHHNTVKFLVAVAPNSNIVFVSEAYGGKISDQKLTIDCEYLNKMPPYMCLLADRGFNIADECAARHIFLSVPPGKRGATQFTPTDVKKPVTLLK